MCVRSEFELQRIHHVTRILPVLPTFFPPLVQSIFVSELCLCTHVTPLVIFVCVIEKKLATCPSDCRPLYLLTRYYIETQ